MPKESRNVPNFSTQRIPKGPFNGPEKSLEKTEKSRNFVFANLKTFPAFPPHIFLISYHNFHTFATYFQAPWQSHN